MDKEKFISLYEALVELYENGLYKSKAWRVINNEFRYYEEFHAVEDLVVNGKIEVYVDDEIFEIVDVKSLYHYLEGTSEYASMYDKYWNLAEYLKETREVPEILEMSTDDAQAYIMENKREIVGRLSGNAKYLAENIKG